MATLDPALCRLPDGAWACVRDNRTEPCGDCAGCRLVYAHRRATATDTYRGCPIYEKHGACSCSTGIPGNKCPFGGSEGMRV